MADALHPRPSASGPSPPLDQVLHVPELEFQGAKESKQGTIE